MTDLLQSGIVLGLLELSELHVGPDDGWGPEVLRSLSLLIEPVSLVRGRLYHSFLKHGGHFVLDLRIVEVRERLQEDGLSQLGVLTHIVSVLDNIIVDLLELCFQVVKLLILCDMVRFELKLVFVVLAAVELVLQVLAFLSCLSLLSPLRGATIELGKLLHIV